MKAHYRTGNGRITFEVEAATTKDLFGHIASLQEVFEESKCGLCGSTDIRFTVRESEGKKNGKAQTYTYYELRCQGVINERLDPCRGRFDFGQSLDTENLFPKRKDAEGNWIPNRGWYVYKPKNGQHEGEDDRREPDRRPEDTTDRRPEPEHATGSASSAGRIGEGSKTPEGLQPSFDRLGDLLEKPAPTRTGPALDMIRDALEKKAGSAGAAKFDRVFRERTGQTPAWGSDAGAIKNLLAALVEVLRDFEVIK